MSNLTFPEFKARCTFRMEGDMLIGEVRVRDRDGRIQKIIASRPVTPVAAKIAAAQGVGWGLGDAWDGVKSTAKAVVKNDVTKALYTGSKVAITTSNKLAQNPAVQAGIAAAVPGGPAIVMGIKAANLIGAATIGKSAAAQQQIAAIASQAAAGVPAAVKAKAVLSSVYQAGKSKNAWSASASKAKTSTSTSTTAKKKNSYAAPLAAAGGLALLLAIL